MESLKGILGMRYFSQRYKRVFILTNERFWKQSPTLLLLVLTYLTYKGFIESNLGILQLTVMSATPAVIATAILRFSPAILFMGLSTGIAMCYLIYLSGIYQVMVGDGSQDVIQWMILLCVPAVPTVYWSFFFHTLYDREKQSSNETQQ